MNASDNKNVLCRNRRLRKSEISHKGSPLPSSLAVVMFHQRIIARFAAVVLEKLKHLPSSPGSPSAGHGEIVLLVAPFKLLINVTEEVFCYNNTGGVLSPAVSDS